MKVTIPTVIMIFLVAMWSGIFGAQAPKGAAAMSGPDAAKSSLSAWPAAAVRAQKGMVVSDEPLACAAGVEILKNGGNAVDATVAVAFTLAVVEPEAGNIGGGGFMMVRLADGKTGFVDYREVAPAGASRGMYLRSDGTLDPQGATLGYRSAGVPGTVAGLELALSTYGTMKLAGVMAPAIRLAEQGFPVSEKLARSLAESKERLGRFPLSRRIFLKGGARYQPGEIFRQPELATTLRRIAQNGASEFYRGSIAKQIAEEMAANGGLITLKDLAAYRAKIREPLRVTYEVNGSQWEMITSPPPSSGGIAMIEALNILGPVALKSGPEAWSNAENVHWVAEAMRRIFADRARYLADADFARVPVKGLTNPRYAAELRGTIQPEMASSSKKIGPGNPMPFDSAAVTAGKDQVAGSREQWTGDKTAQAGMPMLPRSEGDTAAAVERALREAARAGHTTHFSVVDAAGNAVANTYTINDGFGSGVTVAGGFLLNDEMDDFTTAPGVPNRLFGLVQSDANAIEPGKRPLSSMVPTILLRDGRLSFVTGSPGGPRIISATLLSVLNWMRLDMDAQQSINALRFHHQWMPDVVYVERSMPASEVQELNRRGYQVKVGWSIGEVEAIGIDAKTGERLGAADGRREGAAAGY